MTTEEIITRVAGTDICTCLGCAGCSGKPCRARCYDEGAVCVWCNQSREEKSLEEKQ